MVGDASGDALGKASAVVLQLPRPLQGELDPVEDDAGHLAVHALVLGRRSSLDLFRGGERHHLPQVLAEEEDPADEVRRQRLFVHAEEQGRDFAAAIDGEHEERHEVGVLRIQGAPTRPRGLGAVALAAAFGLAVTVEVPEQHVLRGCRR